jgi:hypothetical protein
VLRPGASHVASFYRPGPEPPPFPPPPPSPAPASPSRAPASSGLTRQGLPSARKAPQGAGPFLDPACVRSVLAFRISSCDPDRPRSTQKGKHKTGSTTGGGSDVESSNGPSRSNSPRGVSSSNSPRGVSNSPRGANKLRQVNALPSTFRPATKENNIEKTLEA